MTNMKENKKNLTSTQASNIAITIPILFCIFIIVLYYLFFGFELAIFICLAMSPLIVLAGYVVIYEIFCMDQY